MENLILSAENIFCHLRHNHLNKNYLQIIKQLDNIEKHGCECKAQQHKVLEDLLQMLPKQMAANDDGAVIFSCVILLTYLQEQQKLPCFSETQFDNLWQWLVGLHKCRENSVEDLSRVNIAIGNLFASHPGICDKYFAEALQPLIKNISFKNADILLVTSLQCLSKILSSLKDLSDEQLVACTEAGREVLQLHYGKVQPKADSLSISVIVLSTLQIFHRMVALNADFAKAQISELLGLSKTYIHYGLETSEKTTLLRPQKVNISQQALYDSAEEIETVINSEKVKNCGGKTPKTRKPRTVVKNTRCNDCKPLNLSAENGNISLTLDLKTSDSELSEPENATNRVLFERSRNAKIRLAAISLIGSIARSMERKVMFGYWHALFPSGTSRFNYLSR